MFDVMTIGSFKILCDLIISVRDKALPGKAHRTHNFDQIVDPMFKALQPVVDDYFLFFRAAIIETEEVRREPNYDVAIEKLDKIFDKLRQDRERMLSNRIVLKAMADDLIKRTHDEKYSQFYNAVARIFESVSAPNRTTNKISSANRIIRLSDELGGNETTPDLLLHALQASIADIEQKWGCVTQSYARLRFDCLSRTRLTHAAAGLLHGADKTV